MTMKLVYGVFADHEHASSAIRALRQSNEAYNIKVVGSDNDEFREFSANMSSGKVDRFVFWTAIVCAVLGGFIGLFAVPAGKVNGEYLLLVPLMAAVCGVAVGGYLGLMIAAILKFDSPTYSVPVFEGALSKGKVVIVVQATTSQERIGAEAIMEEHGAIEVVSRAEEMAVAAK